MSVLRAMTWMQRLRGTPSLTTEPLPDFTKKTGRVEAIAHIAPAGATQWYPPVMIGVEAITERLFSGGYIASAIGLMERLTPDDYTTFLTRFYADGLRRFGPRWRYADIVTVLLCLSDILKPQRYLEIGVRRGRSVAAVAHGSSDCAMAMFDLWVPNYAGMETPGANFVRAELKRLGHTGSLIFVDGDSHTTVPAYFASNPDASFDLITVDGDHSAAGATRDLCDVLPRLNIGGAIVFDDICHPFHPELAAVWRRLVVADPRFSAYSFADVGYGVGFAIRKY